MNGREHMFWSLVAFSLGMFIFTNFMNYRNATQLVYILMIALLAFVILNNEYGNALVEKAEKAKRNKEDLDEHKKSKDAKRIVVTRLSAWFWLCVFIAFGAWFSAPSTDNPFFLVAGYVGAFFGGREPDLDKDIVDGDMRFHRNPITHSGIIVMPIAIFGLLTLEDDYISLLLVAIGIMLGVASHLFADNIESNSTFSQVFIDFQHFKQCPGDIRHVRENRQRAWLNFHGIALVFITILLFARFQLAPLMEYPIFWDGWNYVGTALVPMTEFILVFALVYYIASFLMLVAWRKKKESKTSKKRAKKATKKNNA